MAKELTLKAGDDLYLKQRSVYFGPDRVSPTVAVIRRERDDASVPATSPVTRRPAFFGHSPDTKKPPLDGASWAAYKALASLEVLVAGIGFEPMTFRL